LSLTEWQTGRGLLAQAMVTLAPLLRAEDRTALNPQNQMRAAVLVAGCLAGLGQLEPAVGELRQAVALGEGLARQDPSNAAWQRDLSVSLERLGDVQRAQGDLAGALESFRNSQRIFERLARQDPSNAAWQRDLSVSHNKLGDVQLAQGDLAGALESFRKGLQIRERLARQDPSNAEWQRDLSVSHNKLGDVQLAQGDLAGAMESFRKGLQIVERLARQDPSNARWQADRVVSLVRISTAIDATTPEGRETARSALRQALAIAEGLVADGKMTSHEQQDWVKELRRRLAVLESGKDHASA
jgi:tetratricopeptide (TPR) repeat protein